VTPNPKKYFMPLKTYKQILENLPTGSTYGLYEGQKYLITKEVLNSGKSIKLFAKSLASSEFISLNYYKTTSGDHLKPCEMPAAKVIKFLENYVPIAK
jgi:hypothetical protein